jgi:hypothetical protein
VCVGCGPTQEREGARERKGELPERVTVCCCL